MRRLFCLFAVLSAFVTLLGAQGPRPARIQVGDELTVYVFGAADMTGSYTVQSDGSVYVPRIGRLVVNGLTTEVAQSKLLTKLKGIFNRPTATISIKSQRQSSVFVVGGKQGLVPLTPETDLRQVYAAAQPESEPDLLQVSLFRNGAKIATMSATDLTSGRQDVFSGRLQANDLVVFEPKPFIRVWVIGTVQKPGRVRLNVGDDVYRAIAEAGDLPPTLATGATETSVDLRSDYVVSIRRGEEVITVPLVADPAKPAPRLEDGDTVSVQPPAKVRITFTGESKTPGETFFKPGTPLATAVSASGGANTEGSLRGVILFHKGVASFHNMVPSETGENVVAGPILEDGDVVFIPRNERAFYVFGSVTKGGRVAMNDTREYRLSDAVADAGGVAPGGTLTRVTLGRAGADGKLVMKTYRLDKFVKDGDPANNPAVGPNDVVFVDSSRGITFSSLSNVLSTALLLNSFRR